MIKELEDLRDSGIQKFKVTKEEFSRMLKDKLKPFITPVSELKEKYLDKLLADIKNSSNEKVEVDENELLNLITNVWKTNYEKYVNHLESFDFQLKEDYYEIEKEDISQDLPQILGRQRNNENPWKNSAEFYYKSTSNYKKMTKEDFDKILEFKIDQSKKLLEVYEEAKEDNKEALSKKYEEVVKQRHYSDDYVAVTNGIPVFNNFYYVSEMMSFDIQQIDYADRFTVFNKINSIFSDKTIDNINDLLVRYKELNNVISNRLKFICDLYFSKDPNLQQFLDVLPNDDYAKSYYYQLGPERCKAKGYKISDVRQEISVNQFDKKLLQTKIYDTFHEGDKKTRDEIKTLLASIYSLLGYNKTAKATDIEEYFEITQSGSKDNAGKRINLIKLNKKKL